MSKPPLQLVKPLRYLIACAGCRAEVEICPTELDDRIAVCSRCNMPNPTPVFALLSGRQKPPGESGLKE
jgi:hypothetical protein